MKIENDYPKFFIVSETKINSQSFEQCSQQCELSYDYQWLSKWKKTNINTVCSDLEKIPNFFSFLINSEEKDTSKNCIDFNKHIMKNNINFYNDCLKHMYITVVFVDVSYVFLSELKDFNGVYKISNTNMKKINFWLPSLLENEKDIAYEIGKLLVNFVENIKEYYQKILKKYENVFPQKKINEFFRYVMPQSFIYSCIISGSLYDWKNFIVNKTQFHCPDELRYVLMHLLRLFKMKWPTLCDDIMLCDQKDTIYSIDSLITSDFSYQNFCVKKVV